MNKKILKILSTITAIVVLTTGCTAYQSSSASSLEAVIPYLKTSSSDPFAKQMDMDDLEGCPVLIKQRWDGYDSKEGAGADQTWILNGGMWSERGISLDRAEFKSYKIQNSPHSKLVYVGPWKHIKKPNKQIRLISAQENNPKYNTGAMRNYYESMDEENKKIPPMPLKLIKPTYGNELCILKWHNKYGYNAIAETYQQLQPGFWAWLFQDKITIVTGKIIEAKE